MYRDGSTVIKVDRKSWFTGNHQAKIIVQDSFCTDKSKMFLPKLIKGAFLERAYAVPGYNLMCIKNYFVNLYRKESSHLFFNSPRRNHFSLCCKMNINKGRANTVNEFEKSLGNVCFSRCELNVLRLRLFNNGPVSKSLLRTFSSDESTRRDKLSPEVDEATEEKCKKGWKANITVPNILTATRIILTPYLGYLVLIESHQLACAIFVFAGITDLMDGWIARRYPNQSSVAGSFLDPLADKFLVSTLFITLSVVNLIPVPLTVLVLARDVLLIGAAFYVRMISLPPPVSLPAIFNLSNPTAEIKPTFISKLNTAVQLGLVVCTLGAPVFDYVNHPALQALWFITAGTTISSGIGYVFAKGTFRLLKQKKH